MSRNSFSLFLEFLAYSMASLYYNRDFSQEPLICIFLQQSPWIWNLKLTFIRLKYVHFHPVCRRLCRSLKNCATEQTFLNKNINTLKPDVKLVPLFDLGFEYILSTLNEFLRFLLLSQ